jgi:hypothetical protein
MAKAEFSNPDLKVGVFSTSVRRGGTKVEKEVFWR